MSTDSESHSLAEKESRHSGTYSIHSLDDVPVRKSAVQIIRERTELIQPGSPRKKSTMQITKLVLKDPPTSPRRKVTPMVIRSIQTFTSAALTSGTTGESGPVLHDCNNRDEQQQQEDYKIIPLPSSDRLVEQFEAKKNERNQASSEFQNYLLESFNKENRPKSGIEISKATTVTSGSNGNSIQGSKSDSTTSSASSREQNTFTSTGSTSQCRTTQDKSEEKAQSATSEKPIEMPVKPTGSASKRPSRPKSMDSKNPAPEPKKEKSYDPQKAREFIKEQQAKRKLEKKASATPVGEKDLIRKRLDDLKKNTQVLVNKNVQKSRKRSFSAVPISVASSQKSGTAPLKAMENSRIPPQKPLRKSTSTSSLRMPTPTPSTAKTEPQSSGSVKSSDAGKEIRKRSSLLKPDLSERMGIMRKPDEVPLGEIMMSPLRIRTPPTPVKQTELTPKKPVEADTMEGNKSIYERSFSAIEKELKLDVPEVTLVPDSTLRPQDHISDKKEFKSVPPWLRHTLLQPDPYPFIMAVRKKLEAIRTLNHNQSSPDESLISKHSAEAKPNLAETANNQKCLQYLEALKTVPYINKPSASEPNNISSISHRPSESNTTSEISSIKSDFILPLPPLSSTKIDTSLPAARETIRTEVAPISPLSVDRISNLKITANSSLLERSINFNRGTNMPDSSLIPDRISFIARNVQDDLQQSQLSLNTSEKQRNFLRKPMEKSPKELEYQKMLEAFNRSLSQVIEVNQQLYSALKQPAEPARAPERIKIRDEMTQTTPVPSLANASATSNYSEDFERSDGLKTRTSPSPPEEPDSAGSSPGKSFTTETPSATSLTTSNSSSSTTTTAMESSPEESPSKTRSSESQLQDSRSFSLSDSHNTNPPMPEEYLPSFEESLRRKELVQHSEDPLLETTVEDRHTEKRSNSRSSSSSIATQINDEVADEKDLLRREEIIETKSLESISMKISEDSDVLNDFSPPEANLNCSSQVEVLKAVTSSSSCSELEALGAVEQPSSGKEAPLNDTTMGSDILAMFNRTDLEVSVLSTTFSETNMSYSSIGLYDQLIQTEKSKSEQLASRARLKEKALLDRTKGQLAWLELQKQRYRERGMMEQISVIKKKQRAILVRLEKDRAELNKFKKSTPEVSSRSKLRSPMTPKSIEKLNSFSSNSNSISLRKSGGSARSEMSSPLGIGLAGLQQQRKVTTTTTTTITNSQLQLAAVRGMELEPSESLEDILQRREQELQKRRQHVQALLDWHQKLDREEQEILDIERSLLQYNRHKITESSVVNERALSRIRSIEKSLQTLQQIPERQRNASESSDKQEEGEEGEEEEVQTLGSKLNRLWSRLTGVKENRYESGKSYTLTKKNLENLYEDAKMRVLEGFKDDHDMRKALLERSVSGINSSGSVGRDVTIADVSINDRKNESVGGVNDSMVTSEGSSFKTTVNSADLVLEITEKELSESVMLSDNVDHETEDQVEGRSSLMDDVEEIISRVSDITENINGFLSSTTNIDEILHNEQEKRDFESVEFHTIEEEQDTGSQEKLDSEIYSVTFDIPTTEEHSQCFPAAEESQLMIEDISLPILVNDSLLNDSITESITEAMEKVTEEILYETSLEKASSTTSSATTPTTAEETETEYNEVLIGITSMNTPVASELEKRLIILNENLGELSESFERVPLMNSPEVPKDVRQQSSESEAGTPSIVEEEYSTDKDFTAEERRSSTESTEEKPFLSEDNRTKPSQKPILDDTHPEGHKIEVKIRTKSVIENFPLPSSTGGQSTSGTSIVSYLTPPAHGPASASPATTAVANRMPDIINEAEVLRRQQLQIEQEIKQLEQQVVFFREIPNKPPPPYIPPANGSPLALIFPPVSRINELIETRTKDLFLGEIPVEKLTSDHVTNIYEKLILDMCKELYGDLRIPPPDVSFRTTKHDKRPLAFYNPPDRLGCLQSHMKRKVKRILNEEGLLQQQQQQQNQHHCPMPFVVFSGGTAKRKRDQVDEILAQEMFDEEARWTNFDREEIEVKERIVEEVMKMLVAEALYDMEGAWREKYDEVDIRQQSSTLTKEKVEETSDL